VTAAKGALERARTDEAERLARRALALSSAPPEAHAVLVQALAQDGRLGEALTAVQRAVAAHPLDPALRHLQAVVLLESGDAAAAAAAAQRAIYLDPRQPGPHLLLARGRQALGDERGARHARVTGQRLLARGEVGR
jgi:predicted Zn-dependent protease